MRSLFTPIGWPLAVALAAGGLAGAPAPAPAQIVGGGPVLQLNTGRGRLVTLTSPMTDIFISNEAVADVQVRSPTQLYVFGKAQGETTISATSKSGAVIYSATVRVGNNFDSIQQMLGLAMPESHIVSTSMNGLILLTGTVATPEDGVEAERLVQAFVGDQTKVLSRLRNATPLQVNLQVRFAEVSRSFAKNIGVNLKTAVAPGAVANPSFVGNSGQPGAITYPQRVGPLGPVFDANGFPVRDVASTYKEGAQRATLAIAGHLFGADLLSTLELGERDGQVSTLANPNLTVISGETGSFLAGGEIPIPVSQGLGAVSVEYKQYGVSLSYTPTVLSDGRISLRVRPEVSQLSSQGSVQINGTTIPALTTRRAETTVELGSGQSFMIGGLLQNTHNNSIDKTPGVGDLPILGALFRSNAFQRDETELMIVITPYLVKPVNANDIVLPTDGYKAPTDLDRVLLGQIGGGVSGGDRPKPSMAPPAYAAPALGAVATVPPSPQPEKRRDEPAAKAAPPADKPKKGASAAPGFSLN